MEDDDGEDDGHGGDNGEEGDGGGNDDAASIDFEDKDALIFKLELEMPSSRPMLRTLLFLVASTLAPLSSPPTPAVVPSRVVVLCRFCRPLFCFDELPEEHTLPFSATTPSDEDDSNDDDDDDNDFCAETDLFFCTDDCADSNGVTAAMPPSLLPFNLVD